MALFVEVFDEEKQCNIIINLDEVIEIAPKVKIENGKRVDGGCDLFFSDQAAVGGKRAMKVKDSYNLFKQFAMQTVSAEDIAKINGRTTMTKKEKAPVGDILGNIPKL